MCQLFPLPQQTVSKATVCPEQRAGRSVSAVRIHNTTRSAETVNFKEKSSVTMQASGSRLIVQLALIAMTANVNICRGRI